MTSFETHCCRQLRKPLHQRNSVLKCASVSVYLCTFQQKQTGSNRENASLCLISLQQRRLVISIVTTACIFFTFFSFMSDASVYPLLTIQYTMHRTAIILVHFKSSKQRPVAPQDIGQTTKSNVLTLK